MKYSTNYNMNKPELNEQYRLEHWNNNTDIIDTELKRNADNITTAETALQNAISEESSRATTAETALQNITDSTFKTALLNFCYPVGSLYWSSKSDNPSTLFGGTWVQIKDKFIWAKGDSDAVNAIGGSKTVTLTVSNLPAHSHSFSGTTGSCRNLANGEQRWEGWFSTADGGQGHSEFTAGGNMWVSDNTYRSYPVASSSTGNGCRQVNINVDHRHDFSGSTDGGRGTATKFSVMNPYIVKYCWERTA